MLKLGRFGWLVLVVILLMSLPGCGEKTSTPSQPNNTDTSGQATEQQQNLPPKDQSQEAKEKLIPGLEAADIKLNLERTWGLKFSGPQPGETMAQDSGKVIDPDTGVTLECNIFETSPMHILWVDFLVDASAIAGAVNLNTINSVTEGYFSYCATVPYDKAEPAKAKQWVTNNVRKAVKPGNVLSTQIGPVRFEMFGTQYIRTLRVKPAT